MVQGVTVGTRSYMSVPPDFCVIPSLFPVFLSFPYHKMHHIPQSRKVMHQNRRKILASRAEHPSPPYPPTRGSEVRSGSAALAGSPCKRVREKRSHPRALGNKSIVEPPRDLHPPQVRAACEILEHLGRRIDVVRGAAHALVAADCRDGAGAVLDGDGAAAEGVSVGLRAEEQV